ncbi:MAG: tRNA guanosine(34) transglycosylase Tgt [Candidatus Stahlbacteria bacterium]|nr:MAG: tRNA guanosine(34) transglycosylase Tgt [Candidatus Stahlbacteria bacterium]
MIRFRLNATDSKTKARQGTLELTHGSVETPAFMAVATQGTVKTFTPDEVADLGGQILVANAYHLYLRPGVEVIQQAGGVSKFMGWNRPILTDSGGFQIYSLTGLGKITDEGVTFQSHIDGSRHTFTPEKVVEIQRALDSDIWMVLDQPIGYPAERPLAVRSLERTTLWAKRSVEANERVTGTGVTGGVTGVTGRLFGIIQGATYDDLRERSAKEITALPFAGFAIGGLCLGEPPELTYRIIDNVEPMLPKDRIRYVMGAGYPADLLQMVARGADLFDCVLPTRNGRTGSAFTRQGQINLRNACYKDDLRPIEEGCACPACQKYTRAFLRHLFMADEILGPRLLSIHNLHLFHTLMREMREAIGQGRFSEYRNQRLEGLKSGAQEVAG